MNSKSRRAGRRLAWGHASDLRSNYTTDKVVRPELEKLHPDNRVLMSMPAVASVKAPVPEIKH